MVSGSRIKMIRPTSTVTSSLSHLFATSPEVVVEDVEPVTHLVGVDHHPTEEGSEELGNLFL